MIARAIGLRCSGLSRLGAVVLAVVLCGASGRARAADPAPAQARPTTAGARVVAVTPVLRLHHTVDVRVDGLAAWAQTGAPWKLVPYIEQRALEGLYPVAVDIRSGTLQYLLQPTDSSAATWAHLLSPLRFERPVRFSVGLERQDALPTAFERADGAVRLVVVDRWWSAGSAALVLLLGACFVRLAGVTALLMEPAGDAQDPQAARYSLARVQLGLWFFVVLSAFLVIWLTTGNFNSLNASVVGVLGISAGTAVGDSLLRRSGGPAATAVRPGWRSARAFLDDLVCDAQGHSIARFQMLAWTVVLIVVFLADVLDDLVMPTLGPELLYLLGLSAGTCVAHRRGDAPTPPTAPGA